ncbi:MAG TPA: UDP-N-acetylmuramate--L-alanine ligase [Clostridia bacterium]|nr:UDP-N-acetylmuramate--L-alanine ligase [Clostridia bacterium]HRU84704.1 UDP-N-acetylmuramate--L-alanine ligase [Eubacteriales bacterium]
MRGEFKGRRIHFLGVGGISMSALAKLTLKLGGEVSGSDISDGRWFAELSELGAKVYHGNFPERVAAADMLVYTAAIADDDAELVYAREHGIPTLSRHEFLASAALEFKSMTAVAGTHGKTTATSLIAHIFSECGLPFTAHIGGIPVGADNLQFFGRDYFVTEACEYKRAFTALCPDVAVVLNFECDHPDCYKTEAELRQAFSDFLNNLKPGGTVVINGDTAYQKLDIPKYADICTFGFSDINTCRPENITMRRELYSFDLIYGDMRLGRIDSPLFGRHNILNVLASAAVAIKHNLPPEKIIKAVESFRGVERRFERRFLPSGGEVIFDYAHHPSEIKAVLDTAKARTEGTLRLYFQPHTYSRTKSYFENFVKVLAEAPYLALVKTYPARELSTDGFSALDLYSALSKLRAVAYFDELIGVSRHIIRTTKCGDVALVLGAGDIYDIAKLLF